MKKDRGKFFFFCAIPMAEGKGVFTEKIIFTRFLKFYLNFLNLFLGKK